MQKVSFPTCVFLNLHLKAPCGLGMRVYSGRREVWFSWLFRGWGGLNFSVLHLSDCHKYLLSSSF